MTNSEHGGLNPIGVNSGLNTYIGNDWDELLAGEFSSEYFAELSEYVSREYEQGTVYPPREKIFEALKLTAYADTRVVILGQDPYHEPGQAHGLAFSVPRDVPYPPSLQNILKECREDIYAHTVAAGGNISQNLVAGLDSRSEISDKGTAAGNISQDSNAGVLENWARQGVLMLNTVLTVRAHEAGSHRGRGWEQFTDRIIELLAQRSTPMVFILWGAPAGRKKEVIQRACGSTRHLIITAPHPSPLSAYRGFFGGRYFSRANYFLEDNGMKPVDFTIPPQNIHCNEMK